MNSYKTKVNSKDESKEVQELFEVLGYKKGMCSLGNYPAVIVTTQDWATGNYCSTRALGLDISAHENYTEITLVELRDMVVLNRNDKNDRNVIDPEYDDANLYLDSKHDLFVFHIPTQTWKESNLNHEQEVLARLKPIEKTMKKEYLFKQISGDYKLVDHGCQGRAIEIPEGAEVATASGLAVYFWKPSENKTFVDNIGWSECDGKSICTLDSYLEDSDVSIIWQRDSEQDEPFLTPETTLNDQYAEIGEVRQAIHEEAQAASSIDATLTERQSQYGCYEDVAQVTQQILSALRIGNYDKLPAPMKESLHMIASKMARIVNGDPEYLDNWHDIGGYAKLIEKLINGE